MPTNGNIPVSLYFHIPFCTKKCHYCHFFVLPDKPEYHLQLIDALKLEIAQWASALDRKQLASIYFGGGTPSLLQASEIHDLLNEVNRYIPFDPAKIEITLEANPETITPAKMKEFAKAGINRISIGLQTLDNPLLISLGRTHNAQTSIDAVKITSDAGIANISIDLMYDIPGQTLLSWEQTIEQAGSLPITHLSLYNLTIEPNTVFFKYRESLKNITPDPQCSAQMYEMAVSSLKERGLDQYEISAFARNGLRSQHNIGYWTGRPFLGFGPSAFSYWENKRFRSIAHFNRYLEALHKGVSPIDFSEELSPENSRKELLAIGLRLKEGVDCKVFEARHGPLDAQTRKTLESLVKQNLLEHEETFYRLTDHGRLFYDTVAIEII
jgi:oxygen-independent coproporphyrinogen III oxidase